MKKVYDVIVIGLGPGGITLGVELKKSSLDFVIIEKGMPGGKVNINPRVDNYHDHPPIDGPSLAMEFYQKAIDNDVPIIYDEVIYLGKDGDLFLVKLPKEDLYAKKVVVATGTKEKKLGLPKEKELFAKGLSYCALCDGHFFKGQDAIIVGGGNSAFKEAIFLSNLVKTLYLVHRRDEFRADDVLINELKQKNNVVYVTPYAPIELIGDEKFEGLKIENTVDKTQKIIKAEGIFPLIGQIPNTEFIHIDGLLDLYKNVIVDRNTYLTPVKNVYAIGDVTNNLERQIYIAEDDAFKVASLLIKDKE